MKTYHSAYAGSMYPDIEIEETGYVAHSDYAELKKLTVQLKDALKDVAPHMNECTAYHSIAPKVHAALSAADKILEEQ